MLCLVGLFLWSCAEDAVWSESYEPEYSKWYYDVPATFSFDAPDTTERYSLVLAIDHLEDYRYQNLYARISTIFPSGDTTVSVTNFDLATKSGRWYGRCRFGVCHPTAELQKDFRFQELGAYQILVEQHMRENPLQKIPKLTLQLLESAPLAQ